MHWTSGGGIFRLAALVLAGTIASGCDLTRQDAPPLGGPSGFAQSIVLTATPDRLVQDGRSQVVVTAVARDAGGNPISGLVIAWTVRASDGTFVEPGQQTTVTDSNGRTSTTVTAPPAPASLSGSPVSLTIIATPVGTDISNGNATSVVVQLVAPSGTLPAPQAPVPAFTVVPISPELLQLTTFDASATRLNGAVCGDVCTYAWAFGNEQTAAGRIVNYRFQTANTHVVRLTVTSPQGPSTTITQSVTVGPGTVTAVITVSPTNPRTDETVFLDGRSSRSSAGATISDYQWDFGNGESGSGERPTTTYTTPRTYTVRLTIRDSFGRPATTTATVTVVAPTP